MTTQMHRKGVAVASRCAKTSRSVVGSALGGLAAVLIWAPTALADPLPEPAPAPSVSAADPALPAPPDPEAATLTLDANPAASAGVPHLTSPENLPPGTTAEPIAAQPGRSLSYLRDLWQAMRTQEVSMDDALLLLTQRPLDADATPPRGMSAGPQTSRPATVARPPDPDRLQLPEPDRGQPPAANPSPQAEAGAPPAAAPDPRPDRSARPDRTPAGTAPNPAPGSQPPSTPPARPTADGSTSETGPASDSGSDSGAS